MIQENTIPLDLKQLLTSNQAFHYRIIPYSKKKDTVHFQTDCTNIDSLKSELEVLLNYQAEFQKISTEKLEKLLVHNYRQKSSSTQNIGFGKDFLRNLIHTASDFDSSDIHIEVYEEKCRVRLRMDGKLKEQYTIAKTEYPQIINQIKIQAGLDISQKRLAQDGRISIRNGDEIADLRVSSLPTLHGEKIVLRILKRDARKIYLEQLGFSAKELELYLEGIRQPNGIILISGPTGSGKTTTLYATLKVLNKEEYNILTIEDPIEYTLEGINQVQLKEDIGLDFPSALRTFLRQDPDIIMVGEIRDEKTANMAIKAALTGHLVLSTIHTNSAIATIARLQDMGIPGYLVADTLNLSVAQRLVRVLCENCKTKKAADRKDFPINFEIPEDLKYYYEPVGCNKCFHTGYNGRKAIYEILPIDLKVEEIIRKNQSDPNLIRRASSLISLKENALELVTNGNTSVEEVFPLLT